MNPSSAQPIFVCYVPGFDERLVDEHSTPYVTLLRSEHDVASFRSYPSTELVPTIVSGTLPHEHRVWQVRLRNEFRTARTRDVADVLPDVLVSTAQCARHLFDRTYDLAVIPWRRRRRFDLHRFKYSRRASGDEPMQEFAGFRSIFGILGDQAKYIFTKDFAELAPLSEHLAGGERLIEFLEMYALDLVQHWHLDNPDMMRDALSRTDEFIRVMHARCRERGVRFILLVDHGQERVVGTVPLVQALKRTGIPETEYSFIVELASARFWFHTERASRLLMQSLSTLPNTSLLTWREMHEHKVCFEDDTFGELYAYADAGWIFFPHDFYHPIGNGILGLMDRHQRARFRNPVHRGNHGYLPHHACERGWLVVDGARRRCTRSETELIDIAPSLLSLVGVNPPDYMKGVTLFG